MEKFDAPHYTYKMVENSAEKFLREFNSDGILPIPIEEITELKLGISLSVAPEIKNQFGIDGFITADFSQIIIDEFAYNKFVQRTRFSIAHEIGHYILHSEWFKKCNPITFEDCQNFYDCVDFTKYRYIENQANTFASLVLMPTSKLETIFEEKLGYLPKNVEFEVVQTIIPDLMEIFNVSGEAILWRLIKHGILSEKVMK